MIDAESGDHESPLARLLKARILREGPLPFDTFMEAALYDPEWGYYTRGPQIGPGGDFSTSVRYEPFRRAVFRYAREVWRLLGEPQEMRFVELGAGTGQLARTVTETWRAQLPTVPLDYVTVDASAALRSQQASAPGVRSVASMHELPPAPGLVFGNEVLDALPVKRVMGARGGGLVEIVVDVHASGRFIDRLRPLHDPALDRRLARIRITPQPNQICDIAPGLEQFVQDAAHLVERGVLTFVDYGDPAPTLYKPTRLNGTLAAYRAGGKFQNPYNHVGEQDLTADVDFTTVTHAAEGAGMTARGIATQQEWLEALNIHDLGLPDDVRSVAGPAGLGTAFFALAFTRGVEGPVPGF